MSIDLENVVLNDSTRTLFLVAERTGDKKVLSELDAISYTIYLDRYDRCGEGSSAQAEICRQRVRTSDANYAEQDIVQILEQFPEAKQQELQNRAKRFMKDARALIDKK